MKIERKNKYLPYIVIVGVILILGGMLGFREIKNAVDEKASAKVKVDSKKQDEQIISSDSYTLKNGRKVVVEVKLTDVTAIQQFTPFESNPTKEYIYYGQGQIQVLDANDTKKVIDTYHINSLDYYLPQLSFIKPSSLSFHDYNKDENPDFTIAQSQPYANALLYIYTIDSKGKISTLNTDGAVPFSNYTQGTISPNPSFYNGILISGANGYYRWNKDKFEHIDTTINLQDFTYNKDVIISDFHILDLPQLLYSSSTLIPELSKNLSYNCRFNIQSQRLEIIVGDIESTQFYFNYYYKSNSVEMIKSFGTNQPQLTDDQLKTIGKTSKKVIDYCFKESGIPEFIE